jgi:arylsulfatase A-like enzyme
VTGHVCSPTRAGLMTGRYQQRLGLDTGGKAGSGLPMSEKIFPQFLKPAGYATPQFGKWHLGPDLAWSPALRGFNEVFGFLGRGAHDYFKLDDPADPIYRGTNVVKETDYLTDRLGEETATFITRHKAQPCQNASINCFTTSVMVAALSASWPCSIFSGVSAASIR